MIAFEYLVLKRIQSLTWAIAPLLFYLIQLSLRLCIRPLSCLLFENYHDESTLISCIALFTWLSEEHWHLVNLYECVWKEEFISILWTFLRLILLLIMSPLLLSGSTSHKIKVCYHIIFLLNRVDGLLEKGSELFRILVADKPAGALREVVWAAQLHGPPVLACFFCVRVLCMHIRKRWNEFDNLDLSQEVLLRIGRLLIAEDVIVDLNEVLHACVERQLRVYSEQTHVKVAFAVLHSRKDRFLVWWLLRFGG